MKLVEKRSYNTRKHKTNRALFYVYQNLLYQVEEIGVVSINFGDTKSLVKKIDILRNILELERNKRK